MAGLLAACDAAGTDSDDGTDPDGAADALGAALASGEFEDVEFSDETSEGVAKQYQKIVEGMGDVTPTVEVGEVGESGGTATAELQWTWPLGEQEWSYTSEATLLKAGDDWVPDWDPSLIEPSLNQSVVLDASSIEPERGTVLGAGGLALVADRPVIRLGVDRARVATAKAADSAHQLATLVDIDVAPYVKQVKAAGDRAFVEAIVYRREDLPADVGRDYDRIPGVVALGDERPLAPTREFAAPILGTVGEVTAEMIEKDPDRYQIGDNAGLSGLQARYDEQLAGTPGVVVDAVGSDGKERELFREDAVAGTPLKLTLDIDLQQDAERLLSSVGPASALVAIKPSNGDVLVAANGPGNDGYNFATYGQIAPGSTFKSVSSLALLRAGLTPESVVPCTDTIVVDGKSFENYDDYPAGALGRIPLRTAVANSCNTGIISQVDRLADGDLADAAASLGVGIDHDLGFPAFFGTVEPPGSETEKAADMIGQGGILMSPMGMATVAASIQSGKTVLPRLVKTWDVEQADVPELARAESAQLRGLLRGVVTSGSGSLLLDVPGPPVIAKTGTAEFEKDGKVLTHAWMIAAQGDLAVAVFVDLGASGSGTAGPILESFLRAAR
jgi:cell division protein FtsI/penicillin-binding protein 2